MNHEPASTRRASRIERASAIGPDAVQHDPGSLDAAHRIGDGPNDAPGDLSHLCIEIGRHQRNAGYNAKAAAPGGRYAPTRKDASEIHRLNLPKSSGFMRSRYSFSCSALISSVDGVRSGSSLWSASPPSTAMAVRRDSCAKIG